MSEWVDGEFKPVLYFAGSTKGLVLNKVNANALTALYGDETDDWAGKSVEVFTIHTEFQGKVTQGLRLGEPRPMKGKGGKRAAVKDKAGGDFDSLDDEIPF